MLTIFDCEPDQIARSIHEVNENTKAYVGPIVEEVRNHDTGEWELKPEYRGIFQKLAHLEHVYTSFPEGKMRQSELEIGGMDEKQLEQELKDKQVKINEYALGMMQSPDFSAEQQKELINLIHLKVGDVWPNALPTTDQLYARIQELGLELCPAETGPRQRLADLEQSLHDRYIIGMKQIADWRGYPNVFDLRHDDDGLWLSLSWAKPDNTWGLYNEFAFRLRKDSPEPQTPKQDSSQPEA